MNSDTEISNAISIFEIPLLVKIIAQDLDLDSIVACRQVSKAWNDIFSSYEWQSVKIITATMFNCELPDEDDFFCLFKNARFVRSLDLDNSRLLDHLLLNTASEGGTTASQTLPTHGFTRLLSLSSDMVHRADGDQDWVYKAYPELMPTLIRQNPNLQHLDLREYDLTKENYCQELCQAIGLHPSLKTLKYGLHPETEEVLSSTLQKILQWIPETAREVCIGIEGGEQPQVVDNTKDKHGTILVTESDKLEYRGWRPTGLQRLELRLSLTTVEDSTLFPFLRSSPDLTALYIGDINSFAVEPLAKILKEHCPKLIDLELEWEFLSVPELQLLFNRGFVRNQLQSISLIGWSSLVENPFNDDCFDILPTILDSFGPSLQKLRLREGLGIPFEDFTEIFVRCPELRELSMAWPKDPNGTFYRSGPENTSLGLIIKSPWVCTRLEILQLTIVNNECLSLSQEELDQKSPQEQQDLRNTYNTARLESLFKQLGQMTWLREIHLGWTTCTPSPKLGALSVMMELHWPHLEQLSRLERFMVRSYEDPLERKDEPHPFKTPHRLKWIKKHWPCLLEIQELFVTE